MMNRTLPLLVLLTVLPARTAFAQHEEAEYTRHSLYFELFGQGIFYSVNYEFRFSPAVSARIGFTSWTLPSFFVLGIGDVNIKAVPVTMSYLTGEGNSHFELGAGAIMYSASVEGNWLWGTSNAGAHTESGVLGTATIGYRYQPTRSGLLFKIGFTPIFSDRGLLPFGGLSLGVAF